MTQYSQMQYYQMSQLLVHSVHYKCDALNANGKYSESKTCSPGATVNVFISLNSKIAN